MLKLESGRQKASFIGNSAMEASRECLMLKWMPACQRISGWLSQSAWITMEAAAAAAASRQRHADGRCRSTEIFRVLQWILISMLGASKRTIGRQ